MKIIHTGDIHIGSAFSGLPRDKAKLRQTEILDGFCKLCAYAKQINADAVLVAGDLFDTGDIRESVKREVFSAMENAMPQLEVKARRVGGSTYQVPIEVRPARRETLGLRWITNYCRARGEKTMKERLSGEILVAVKGIGGAAKKREDTHKMAEANKAFAHYRW